MTKIAELIGIKEPKVWKSKLPGNLACANPDLIVGMEIETEGCRFDAEQYARAINPLWEIKRDGSLRGNAYEFVSKPTSIKILIPELADFFVKTGFNEANYTDRCSIHVHTNITDMTVDQVATLCLVYSIMEELLFEFVNRYKCPSEHGYSRDTNIYCVPWNQCRMSHNMVKTMFADATYAFRNWQKYTALNLLPARSIGTLEWRHMHGTADVQKITQWLNIIGSIVKYAQTNEFEKVTKTIKELNDTSAYRQFYTEVFQDYLPYTDEYTTAIYSGVVNAKYALIGLKEGDKPSLKPKAATRAALDEVFPDEDVSEPAPAGLAGFAREQAVRATDTLLNNPLRWDDFVRVEGAPPTEAVVGQDEVVRRAIRPARAQVNQGVAREAPPHNPRQARYPIRRGTITTPRAAGGAVIHGAMDNLGRLFTMDGARVEGRFDVIPDGNFGHGYIRGFGRNDFWANVTVEWRPEQQQAEF